MNISKMDIVLAKDEDLNGLLFVVTNVNTGWFNAVARVSNGNVVHAERSFDDVDVVGCLSQEQFKSLGYDKFVY